MLVEKSLKLGVDTSIFRGWGVLSRRWRWFGVGWGVRDKRNPRGLKPLSFLMLNAGPEGPTPPKRRRRRNPSPARPSVRIRRALA